MSLHGRIKRDAEHIDRFNLTSAEQALAVLILSPNIRAFLEQNDPKALKQARAAFTLPGTEDDEKVWIGWFYIVYDEVGEYWIVQDIRDDTIVGLYDSKDAALTKAHELDEGGSA